MRYDILQSNLIWYHEDHVIVLQKKFWVTHNPRLLLAPWFFSFFFFNVEDANIQQYMMNFKHWFKSCKLNENKHLLHIQYVNLMSWFWDQTLPLLKTTVLYWKQLVHWLFGPTLEFSVSIWQMQNTVVRSHSTKQLPQALRGRGWEALKNKTSPLFSAEWPGACGPHTRTHTRKLYSVDSIDSLQSTSYI